MARNLHIWKMKKYCAMLYSHKGMLTRHVVPYVL